MARKRTPIGCLFYMALVLLALVIFLFNRSRVQEVIEKTGFTRLFERRKQVEVVVKPEPPAAPQEKPPAARRPPAQAPQEVEIPVTKPAPREKTAAPQPSVSKTPERTAPAVRTRQARLFFIAVQPDGGIQLKSVIRPVEYTDAPLTSTLQALLTGPSSAEVNQGLLSLISPDTRLLKVYVRDGTAFLDFSESFRFNSLGKEGLAAQLKQVVYSATEFPTVKRVQILIEGQNADYLGPEGLYIGRPLSRESFSQ